MSAAMARSNNGMHPTRGTPAFINLNLAGGRVLPGVSRLRSEEPSPNGSV
jgi:hypothetical protein